MWSVLIEKKIIYIIYINYYNDLHEIYNFGTPFLGHHYYILSLSDQCPREKIKRFLKEMMHFHYDLHGHALAQKNPAPGVKKFTIRVDPSLVIITTYLVCLIYAWE